VFADPSAIGLNVTPLSSDTYRSIPAIPLTSPAIHCTVVDDTYLTYELPSSLTRTVSIRVMDTDRTPGFRQRDTVYVDHMFIRVQ
jgi:hypothetical protein